MAITNRGSEVPILSRDYWFKVIEMLQQNWALIDPAEHGVDVFFVHDGSGVFDEMHFASLGEATGALCRNGFRRYAEDAEAQTFIAPPVPPFRQSGHPNGPIYSSGRFWK